MDKISNFHPADRDNLRQTVEKLKMLTGQFLKDCPADARNFEEGALTRDKMIKIVDPHIINAVLKDEQRAEAACKPFDFEREIIMAADNAATPSLSINAKAFLHATNPIPTSTPAATETPKSQNNQSPYTMTRDSTGKVHYGKARYP